MLSIQSRIFTGLIIPAMLLFIACPENNDNGNKTTGRTFTISTEIIGQGEIIITPEGPYKQNDVITLQPVTGGEWRFFEIRTNPNRPLTGISDNKWTFVMPGRNTEVTIEFLHMNEFPFSIIKGTHAGGDFTISPEGNHKVGTRIVLKPMPESDVYRFDRWTTTPPTLAASIVPDSVSGQWVFNMLSRNVTINAVFEEDPVPLITTGAIKITPPVVNATAPVKDAAINSADVTGNFSVKINSVYGTGKLEGGKFSRRSVYTYVLTLTPNTDNRFGTSSEITVTDLSGVPYEDVHYSFTPGSPTAAVTIKFPGTAARPKNPSAIDRALGRGSTAVAANTSGSNSTATAGRPFEGTSHLLSDTYMVWQAAGDPLPHWLSVDLGEVMDIGTVVITWGAGSGNLWDGMVSAVIQVCDGAPAVMPEGEALWNTSGNYSDYGWKTVGALRNIARAEVTPGVLVYPPIPVPNPTPSGYAYTQNRADNKWANLIVIDESTRGRYIRIKVAQPTRNPGNASHEFGAWTSWQRISAFEVYQERFTDLEPDEVINSARNISGKITGEDGKPISGVGVSINKIANPQITAPIEVSTVADGTYTLTVRANTGYTITVYKAGYKQIKIDAYDVPASGIIEPLNFELELD